MKKTVLLACAALILNSPAWAGSDMLKNVGKMMLEEHSTSSDSGTTTTTGNLITMASSTLGITDQQAAGGMGALFGYTKNNLSNEDFSKLSSYVPDMDTLLKAAPVISGGNSNDNKLGDLMKAAGGMAASMQGLDIVYEQFEKLGLSKEMVSQFVSIAMSYLNTQDSSGGVAGLFQKSFSALK